MYEVEVEHATLGPDSLPPEIRSRFLEERAVTHVGHLAWEEHCNECAWPQCYTTCDLYNRRNDGACRRTFDGFAPVHGVPIFGGHVVRVRFRRWGNIMAHGHVALRPVAEVARTERRLNVLSDLAANVPNLGRALGRPGLPSRAVRRLKARSVDAAPAAHEPTVEPNCFLLEVYNPSERTVEVSLDIAAHGHGIQRMPYRRLLRIEPGFHRLRFPWREIEPKLLGAREAFCSLNPNIVDVADEGLTLFFGLATFAHDPSYQPTTVDPKKVKVVVWDLDGTVWDGILVEDGAGNVRLRSGIREVIEALDRRGIVNSIASKNHEGAALAELERLGLRHYFVFPMIGWGPKSDAVRRIIRAFNVGDDTIAFVDDQPFEREEVRAAHPSVRVYTHQQAPELLARAEFDVPVTEEARGRRAFYQSEEVRKHALEESGGDYLAFLRQSRIQVQVARASLEQLDRIHELVQRTNQMNFSGNRHSKSDLAAILSSAERECYVIDAEDVYGRYGSIGFAVVRPGPVPRVIDLAFSCRVQSKRVEHAVLGFLMERYAARGARDLEVFHRASEKNRPVAQVFPDLGFAPVSQDGSDSVYRRSVVVALPDTSVVTVTFRDPPAHESASRAQPALSAGGAE